MRLGLIERRSVCLKRGVVLAIVLVLVVATLGGVLALNNGVKNETTGATSPYVSQFSLPTPDSVPMAITADSNGSVWFAAANKTTLVRFTPSTGRFAQFKIPTKANSSNIWGMGEDKAGRVWFTSSDDDSVWSFDPTAQTFRQYPVPTPSAYPMRLAIDGAGRVWFTEFYSGKIGVVNPSTSEVGEYQPPTGNSGPREIQVAADGVVWFVEGSSNKISKFDPTSGTFVEYSPSPLILSPTGLALDGSGGVWFAEHGGSLIGRFLPASGKVVKYATSSVKKYASTLPYWLAIDASGRVWFNEHTGNKVSVFDPRSKTMVEYPLPSGRVGGIVNAVYFALAPDGRVWFTEMTENKIGVVDTARTIPFSLSASPASLSLKPGGAAKLAVSVSGSSAGPVSFAASSTLASSGGITNETAMFSVQMSPRLSGGSPDLSDLTVSDSGVYPPGDYTLTVSATDGSVVYAVIVNLTLR